MDAPGWLSQLSADVPAGDEWLGDNERLMLARLHVAPRRASWRLGRWTAKAALAVWLGVPPSRVEVLAAPDGAPQVCLNEAPVAVSLSLSHRGGRALAVRSGGGGAAADERRDGEWAPLRVGWAAYRPLFGWWRAEPG